MHCLSIYRIYSFIKHFDLYLFSLFIVHCMKPRRRALLTVNDNTVQ
jgi:hypothetical protein